MGRTVTAGITLALSLFLFSLIFFAPWLAADPGAYIPPWLEGLLGMVDAAGDNIVTDVVGGLLNTFGVGGNGDAGGLPVDLKSIDALNGVVGVLQHEGKFTAWNLMHQSFISTWVKIALGMLSLTAFLSLISGLLSLFAGSELVQVSGWIAAIVGVMATALLVTTMPMLLHLGASNDIGMAMITAVFNVHLGYGFWTGLILNIVLAGLNIILALTTSSPSRHSRSSYQYRHR